MRRFYLIVLFLFIFSFLTNENIGKDVYYGNTWGNRYLTKSNVLAALECVIDSVPCQIMWYSNDNECLAIDDRIKRVLENFDCSVCCTSVTKQGDIYVQRVFEEFNISIAQRSLHILGYVSCNNHVLKIQNYPVFRPYKVENVVEEKWELDYFVEYPI